MTIDFLKQGGSIREGNLVSGGRVRWGRIHFEVRVAVDHSIGIWFRLRRFYLQPEFL